MLARHDFRSKETDTHVKGHKERFRRTEERDLFCTVRSLMLFCFFCFIFDDQARSGEAVWFFLLLEDLF